jgi:hypothetical protein
MLALSRIERENPRRFERQVAERPLPLFCVALERMRHDVRAVFARNRNGPISTAGIHDKKMWREIDNAAQARLEVAFLVERQDDHRQRQRGGGHVRLTGSRSCLINTSSG